MTHLQIPRIRSVLKWVFSTAAENRITGSIPVITQNPRFYGKKMAPAETGKSAVTARTALAKASLVEYLYITRDITFQEAEHLGYNSTAFVENLLKIIDDKEEDVSRALRRYLRYHPINEFEPFFESLGLKPSEYASLLPRGMIFLSDDPLLMENYNTLCRYGIPSNKIGKIYLEVREIFRYDYGVLRTKLVAYEKLGLSQSTVAMLAVSGPTLLIGDINSDFVKVLDKMKSMGFEVNWIDGNLSESPSLKWGQILELLCFLSKIVSSKELGELINRHPGLLFYCSGDWTLLLIGFLLKCGCTVDQIHSLLLQFPQIHVENFVSNLKRSVLFLNTMGMESEEIVKFVCSHPLLLGSCQVRISGKLLRDLKASKQQLCSYIKKNPLELKNWGLGSKPKPLPKSEEKIMEETQKAKFLSEMELDEILFRGKRAFTKISCRDLQERFDVLVKAGLDQKDVSRMVRRNPELLMKSKDMTQRKIDYLVNSLGYPVSTLVKFPLYLRLSSQKVKSRMEMYKWLKEEEAVNPKLSISTILRYSDKEFISLWVASHRRGLEVWEDLKKQISGRLLHLKDSEQQLCSYIEKNPLELKNWGLGSKPKPLPKSEKIMEQTRKAKFLSEMELDEILSHRKGAFTKISCKDLQERFDVLVKAGLDRKDVSRMVRCDPELLMKSKDMTQRKIDYLVNSLGYPISTLVKFPLYLRLSSQRVKSRMEMYKWLKEEEAVNPKRSISTILRYSDKDFISLWVASHPRGLEVWEDLKKQIYSE